MLKKQQEQQQEAQQQERKEQKQEQEQQAKQTQEADQEKEKEQQHEQKQQQQQEEAARKPVLSREERAFNRMDEEKRQLADSIFGGSGASSSGSVSPRTGRKSRAKKSRAARLARKKPGAATSAATTAAPTGDLLSLDDGDDLLGDSTTAMTAATSNATADDLLGGLFDSPSSQEQQQPSQTNAAKPPSYDSVLSGAANVVVGQSHQDEDLLGDFGGSGSDNGVSNGDNDNAAFGMESLSMGSSNATAADAGNSNFDLLSLDTAFGSSSANANANAADDLLGLGASSGSTSTNDNNDLLMPTTTTATAAPPSASDAGSDVEGAGTVVAKDGNFVVSIEKELADSCLHLDVHVHNKTSHVSSGLVVRLEGSRGLDRTDARKLETRLSLKAAAGESAELRTSWSCDAAHVGMSITGQISYLVSGQTKTLRFKVPVTPPDVLRPASIDTGVFAAMWQQYRSEMTHMIPSSRVSTVEGLKEYALANANLHPVDVINNEVIMAARVLDKQDATCLVHFRLSAPSLHVFVRTKTKEFTIVVMQSVVSLLSA